MLSNMYDSSLHEAAGDIFSRSYMLFSLAREAIGVAAGAEVESIAGVGESKDSAQPSKLQDKEDSPKDIAAADIVGLDLSATVVT